MERATSKNLFWTGDDSVVTLTVLLQAEFLCETPCY